MAEGAAKTGRAPGVVAVVVTTDPGEWFAETLEALAAQTYGNLSVLVLVSGGGADPTAMVAEHLPEAFVRRLPDAGGFGAAVAEALSMVEGASFFLLCHDDCAPASDAVQLMVEEAFRSNAGMVSPKMVRWDDPRLLLHVGQHADKTGAVVERVQDGEIDAGQHDAVRDVFVAPGGCTLVRADLLRALGGFDAALVAMGEDLDLSWRAHVAGARVVVAPAATVRHLELVAGGHRPPPPSDAPSLQALQRRHELAAILSCYSWSHLLRVVPQALLLALGELTVASIVGDRRRARAILHAWRWNLARHRELRRRRRAVAAIRALSDKEVRSLQVSGSARLSTYLSRLTHQGIDVAHGLRGGHEGGAHAGGAHAGGARAGERDQGGAHEERGHEDGGDGHDAAARDRALGAGVGAAALTGSVGTAFSEDADFDELDDLGRRGRRRSLSGERFLASRRSRAGVALGVAAVLVIGSRGLLGAPLPLVGQFVGFFSWTRLWQQFFSSWQPAGLGAHVPASPAFGILAIAGTVLLGHSGLLQEVVVLGCIPLGAWGAARVLRPFGSARARLVAAIAYLALPLGIDALARGRWDGLVAYAATPWIVLHLARVTQLEPFGAGMGRAATRPSRGAPSEIGSWRRSLAFQVLGLGAIEAVTMSFAPAMIVVVLVVGCGLAVGSLLAGGARRGARAALGAVGATVVAAVLCAPWAVATLRAGGGALVVLGLPTVHESVPGWSGLLRMAVGPVGSSPLVWLLLAVAVVPLLVARGERLAWATRLWVVALVAWMVALVASKGWALPFAPSLDVLLAPAALAVGVCVGLAVRAFETDLAGYRFGWRQALAGFAVVAIVLGVVPSLVETDSGRWTLPTAGYQGAAGLPSARPSAPGYRVLWLGAPQSLPLGAWPIGPGLAYATSSDGTPTLADLWVPASPGKAERIADALRVAMRGETVHMGRLLAADRIRYVVVVDALFPNTPGTSPAPTFPVPAGLVRALARQEDFRTVPVGSGAMTVFENAAPALGGAPPVTGHAGGPLGPVAAGAELCLWLVAALALVGRRRWLDPWWGPLTRSRTRSRRPRPQHAAVQTGTPTSPTIDTVSSPRPASGDTPMPAAQAAVSEGSGSLRAQT
jgi:GT2 family glycosyltransferase